MDAHKLAYNPNPRESANPISVLFFWYTIGMFRKGYKKVLEVIDLYNPMKEDRSTALGNRLENQWNKELDRCKPKKSKPSLLKTIARTFWFEYSSLALILFIAEIPVRLMQPLMLGKLLEYFQKDSQMEQKEVFIYAGIIVSLNAMSALLINHYIIGGFHAGMKLRIACCALVYRKSLRLSRTALGETASGKVVNLLSNDVSRFDAVSIFLNHMWVAPTSAIIVGYFLWREAGYAGLVGIAVVFTVVPLQSYTGKLSSRFRLQTAYKTDERVRLMDEIISGVQVIKMYAWEKPFTKLIQIARRLELKIITKTSYVRGLFMTFNLFTTRVALFCALLTMVLLGQDVSANKVFVFASYFGILAQTMASMFVRGVSEVAEVLIGIKRIQAFLLNEEFETRQQIDNNNTNNGNKTKYSVKLENMTAKWIASSAEDTLSNINLNVLKGQLIGVIGPVGSGKSSLLQAILGELQPSSGSILVDGKVSYASQEPWVFAASVRQNILFGLDYNKSRYNHVVKVCALEKDFKQLPFGDQTLVGDRGASLSGGQKARINLARAVYRKADIFLLDDPLSAVDTHVAKHLFDECINGYLGNKTRILVTHQIHYLKNADHIIIVNNGKIEIQGTYNSLASSDAVFAHLMAVEPEPTEEEKVNAFNAMKLLRQQSSVRSKSNSITSTMSESMSSIVDSIDNVAEEDIQREFEEQTSKGKVQGSVGLRYFLGGGNYFFVFIVVSLYLMAQGAASATDFWVSFWTKQEDLRRLQTNNETRDEYSEPMFTTDTCLYIHGSIVAALFFIALTRSMSFYKLAMRSSQHLHDLMFNNIINAKMRFFNTNPAGRILNRFAKDVGCMDELLPKAILDSWQIVLSMFGSIILTMTVNEYFLIPVGVIAVFFWVLRVVFLKTSKNLKRLEGITRSPVFTHLNATLQGLPTIRAYGAEDILQDEFDKHQDLHTSAWYMYIASSSAFGFSLDILCFFYTASITFSFLFMKDVFGGQVGLAITQATALTGLVQWGIRQSAEVSNQLMSVERVLEYTDLPSEPQPAVPKKPKTAWPHSGRISFRKVGMRYAETEPLVLRDLNVTIQPKEKIGIVGRTGAGKSSLITALFRLANVEGTIEIDGIDTKDLELQFLRSKISIIPQDPVLFSGTLRRNLDPFEEYPDNVLWRALEEVELKDIAAAGNKLESRVMDRGSNFSVGQRQLVCLARAIIRNNKILMLDEATANVDPQTDALIQKTIRRKFADCTVLTVAHRLNTIMDSDKVMVMESGSLIEFDHPHTLLQNVKGPFSKMVAESGLQMADQLKQTARENYQQTHTVTETEEK